MWLNLLHRGRRSAADEGAALFPSGLSIDALVAAVAGATTLSTIEPDRTPPRRALECGDPAPSECGDRTPIRPLTGLRGQPTELPKPRHDNRKTPSTGLRKGRGRALRDDELPDMTFERVIELGEGCVDENGSPSPLDLSQPIEVHAQQLLALLNRPDGQSWFADPPICSGSVVPGLFSFQLENAYYALCLHRWWQPYRWEGTGGVAEHVGRLLRRKRRWATRYAWCCWPDGRESRRVFYPLSSSTLAAAVKVQAVRARKRVDAKSTSAPARRAA
jgi:hypothetical protein